MCEVCQFGSGNSQITAEVIKEASEFIKSPEGKKLKAQLVRAMADILSSSGKDIKSQIKAVAKQIGSEQMTALQAKLLSESTGKGSRKIRGRKKTSMAKIKDLSTIQKQLVDSSSKTVGIVNNNGDVIGVKPSKILANIPIVYV